MRKAVLVFSALFAVVTASLASPVEALAGGTTHNPRAPGQMIGSFQPGGATTLSRPRTATGITCDGAFHSAATPNGVGNNYLFATATISPNDIWAVGASNSSNTTNDRTLAEHWNGTTWTIVPTPNPSSFFGDLNGVAAISTSDVWAVGFYQYDSLGDVATFAEHWNGATWTLDTSTFNPSGIFSGLFGVTAISTNDVWAVGTYFVPNNFFTIIEHWNGVSWTQFASPNPSPSDNELFAVSGFNSTDIWAVGEDSNGGPLQSLAAHWNGSSWSLEVTGNLGAGSNVIADVKALEAGHAVGVGYGNFVSNSVPREGESWDLLSGGGTTNAAQPGPGSGDNVLEGVAISGSGVFAVGYSQATPTSAFQTMVRPATWVSSTHTVTWGAASAGANPSTVNNVLYAVSASSPFAFWAVGFDSGSVVNQTLAESYCGLHFNVTAPPSIFGRPSSFSITVTAQTPSNATITSYKGTVHFTSSDPGATLPGDYTFVPGDSGTHTFSGVLLQTPGSQTITATDTVYPASGFATVVVSCVGACQSTAGTPGSRGVNQSTAGTPGPRLSSSPQAPRSRYGALGMNVDASTATSAAIPASAPAAGSKTSTKAAPAVDLADAKGGTAVAGASVTEGSHLASTLVARSQPLSTQQPAPWYLLIFVPILAVPVALARRRRLKFKEKSNARLRP